MVLILLSTYNGQRYLKDQLDSLLNQEDIDFHILIRDDGSSDRTMQILEEYRNAHKDLITLIQGENLGSRESFFELVKTACADFSEYEYFAFADQDDVWMPGKLSRGIQILSKSDNPCRLYYCDPILVDSNLQKISGYHLDTHDTLEEAFIIQPALGCTSILSFPLLEKMADCPPSMFAMHDACAYMLNLALGGFLYHDSEAMINYRQHSSNAIGYNQSFLYRWRRRFLEFKNSPKIRSRQAKAILDLYSPILPAQQRKTLQLIVSQNSSLKDKIRLLFSPKFSSRKRMNNLLFRIAVLCNKL